MTPKTDKPAFGQVWQFGGSSTVMLIAPKAHAVFGVLWEGISLTAATGTIHDWAGLDDGSGDPPLTLWERLDEEEA